MAWRIWSDISFSIVWIVWDFVRRPNDNIGVKIEIVQLEDATGLHAKLFRDEIECVIRPGSVPEIGRFLLHEGLDQRANGVGVLCRGSGIDQARAEKRCDSYADSQHDDKNLRRQ